MVEKNGKENRIRRSNWVSDFSRQRANTACTRPPANNAGAMVVRSLRVFKRFSWLEVGSGKLALSRPAHPSLRDNADHWAAGALSSIDTTH
jgi:hypothetical protein